MSTYVNDLAMPSTHPVHPSVISGASKKVISAWYCQSGSPGRISSIGREAMSTSPWAISAWSNDLSSFYETEIVWEPWHGIKCIQHGILTNGIRWLVAKSWWFCSVCMGPTWWTESLYLCLTAHMSDLSEFSNAVKKPHWKPALNYDWSILNHIEALHVTGTDSSKKSKKGASGQPLPPALGRGRAKLYAPISQTQTLHVKR